MHAQMAQGKKLFKQIFCCAGMIIMKTILERTIKLQEITKISPVSV